MAHNRQTGDFFLSGIDYSAGPFGFGQVFRVRGDLMEYCFARVANSPFDVNYTDASKVVFCYAKGKKMQSHRGTGCDGAQITLELKSTGTLEMTFMMSPPVKHAWNEFVRVGPPPALSFYKVANIHGSCDPENPGPPTRRLSDAPAPDISSMCPAVAKRSKQSELGAPQGSLVDADGNGWACRSLDGSPFANSKVDIRLQHKQSMVSCWPCKVSYSISAKIPEDQYIAIGFKGLGYRAFNTKTTERPNYFGMTTDEIDEQHTTSVIVLGYVSAAGGCVREMKAENYVGTPTDVKGNPHLSDASVERKNGRTVIRFTVEQHAGKNALAINTFFNQEQISMRVMWAIGSFSEGGGCKADIQMHTKRGVSPLGWFDQNPICVFDPVEFGSNATSTGVEPQQQAILRADVDATVVV
jgi:hypothetical protein